jgi:hypothetical protein
VLERTLKEKEEKMRNMKNDAQRSQDENSHLREENNMI